MDILRIGETPKINFIPRRDIEPADLLEIHLINEFTNEVQAIFIQENILLANETFLGTIFYFPDGNPGDKFSYTIIHNQDQDIICMGKLMILSETESIQDYSTKENDKYYT